MKRAFTALTFLLAAYAAIVSTPGVVAQGRQLLFPSGTEARPGVAVEGEQRTGIFLDNDSNLGVSIRGTSVAKFGSAGLIEGGPLGTLPLTTNQVIANDDVLGQFGTGADASIAWDNGNAELDITSVGVIHESQTLWWQTLGTGSFDGWFVEDGNNQSIIEMDVTPGTNGLYQLRGDLDGMTAGGYHFRLRPATFPALASGVFRYLNIPGNSTNHTGGTIVGIDFENSNADAQAAEYGIRFPTGGYDAEIKIQQDMEIESTSVGQGVIMNLIGVDYAFEDTPAATVGGNLFAHTATLNAMNGSDTLNLVEIAPTNANHTGAGNALRAVNVAGITGDADAIETAYNTGSGWDVGITLTSVLQANLVAAANGSIVYCSDCNPDATCTGSGAGGFAYRIAGAWACELN